MARTNTCTPAEARRRLAHAAKFLEVAQLVLDEEDGSEYSQPAAPLAVLSGIAAGDAVCCLRLQRRSRGQSHDEAVALLESAGSEGRPMARDLKRLLDLKDQAHYAAMDVANSRAKDAVAWAVRLYQSAESLF
jgi:hypothetical protein